MVNLTSATVGVGLLVLFAIVGALNLGVAPPFLIFWALSILIEGAMLTALKCHPLRQTRTATIAINVASYAFLFALAVFFERVTACYGENYVGANAPVACSRRRYTQRLTISARTSAH